MKQKTNGHLAALFTVTVWGATFVCTKTLLRHFTPVEILLLRFTLGGLALCIASPGKMPLKSRLHELYFAAAGFSGLACYYLCENIALRYGDASLIGVLVSSAPLFAGIFGIFFLGEKLRGGFAAGFAIAMAGIVLISLGSDAAHIQPKGLALSLLAAAAWGIYSPLTRKIADLGYPALGATRRIFLYGIVMMVPAALLDGFRISAVLSMGRVEAANLCFLGLCASAVCFLTWNYAVGILGSMKTCAYIYLSPVITVILAAIILRERLSGQAMLGIVMVLAGLALSEWRPREKGLKQHGAI